MKILNVLLIFFYLLYCLSPCCAFFRGHLRRSKPLLESCDFSVKHRNYCSTAILLPFGTVKEHVKLQPHLSLRTSAFGHFSVCNQWHKYWASYLFISSTQQVSELIMSFQITVDVDSGNDKFAGKCNLSVMRVSPL